MGDPCALGGSLAWLYAIQLEDGLPALNFATGEKLDSPDGSEPPSTDTGSGIPSDPEVILGQTGDTVVVGTTDGEITDLPLPSSEQKRIRYWREVY